MNIQLKFIGLKTGNEILFTTEPNPLITKQMYWFDSHNSMYYGTKQEVKKIIKDIKNSCEIISEKICI